jgi:hypothetical protein
VDLFSPTHPTPMLMLPWGCSDFHCSTQGRKKPSCFCNIRLPGLSYPRLLPPNAPQKIVVIDSHGSGRWFIALLIRIVMDLVVIWHSREFFSRLGPCRFKVWWRACSKFVHATYQTYSVPRHSTRTAHSGGAASMDLSHPYGDSPLSHSSYPFPSPRSPPTGAASPCGQRSFPQSPLAFVTPNKKLAAIQYTWKEASPT